MNLGDEGAFFYKQISISGLCLWLGAGGIWGHGHFWPWQCWAELNSVGCGGFSSLSSSMIPYCLVGFVHWSLAVCSSSHPCSHVSSLLVPWCSHHPRVPRVPVQPWTSEGARETPGYCPDTCRTGSCVGRVCFVCSVFTDPGKRSEPPQGTAQSQESHSCCKIRVR